MDICPHCFLKYSRNLENLDPSTPKPQNIDVGLSFDSNRTIESPKKGPARAILLLSNFSKFHQSNVARAGPFFGLSIAQLLLNDCPTSIFWGLGVDGSRFSRLGLKLWKQWGPMSILAHFWPVKDPPYYQSARRLHLTLNENLVQRDNRLLFKISCSAQTDQSSAGFPWRSSSVSVNFSTLEITKT